MEAPSTTLRRRDVLKAACALPLATVAGCTDGGDDGELPSYAEDTPREGADDEAGVFFVHLDAEWLREFDGEEELPYANELPDAVDVDSDPDSAMVGVDPLVAYPAAGLVVAALGLGFGLLPYGFGDELLASLDGATDAGDAEDGDDEDDEGGEDDVRVDSILLVDGVAVLRGSFDRRAVVAASEGFEPAGERDGFEVYEGTGEGFLDTTGLAFAVRDDVLIALVDEDADLGAVIDSGAGDVDRLSDDDDGDWLLRTGGHGHVTLGAWEIEPEGMPDREGFDGDAIEAADALDDAVGVASSLTLSPEEGRASLAAVFQDGEAPSRTEIEDQVGASATSRDVSVEGTRVSVSGAWRADADRTADD